jgi:hypothetical protein
LYTPYRLEDALNGRFLAESVPGTYAQTQLLAPAPQRKGDEGGYLIRASRFLWGITPLLAPAAFRGHPRGGPRFCIELRCNSMVLHFVVPARHRPRLSVPEELVWPLSAGGILSRPKARGPRLAIDDRVWHRPPFAVAWVWRYLAQLPVAAIASAVLGPLRLQIAAIAAATRPA